MHILAARFGSLARLESAGMSGYLIKERADALIPRFARGKSISRYNPLKDRATHREDRINLVICGPVGGIKIGENGGGVVGIPTSSVEGACLARGDVAHL